MKSILKYTITTVVMAGSVLVGNANAIFIESITCTEKFGASLNPKDLPDMSKCAKAADKHPKFAAALAANPNCAAPKGAWAQPCNLAKKYNATHQQVAAAQGAAAAEAKLHKELDAATAQVAKDDAALVADGSKTEKDQAKHDADEAKRAALEEQVNALGTGADATPPAEEVPAE